ncbi:M23 family metallopeptidase [Microbacterium sp. NPDC076895]|uniref:M23 family metallopeptidase n=1 Tax=Microbacterium sp. NPDC076895 TaxID=3154957 RepID=UPI00341D9E29
MAEENDSTPVDAAGPSTRKTSRLARIRRGSVDKPAAKPAPAASVARPAVRKGPKASPRGPVRNIVTLAIVGGLVATVALPAYGAFQQADESVTLQQVAEGDAQSIVIASDAATTDLNRESYSATTPEEIEKKKAEEAAAAAARSAASLASSSASVNINMVAPGSGAVRWPVASFHSDWAINGFRTPTRPNHNGLDMLNSGGTPIFAAADGVVRAAQDGLGGYGNAVVIDSVIGGQVVTTLYAHMMWGSRTVEAGQTVSAGQMIGLMGQTGSATTTHLHFEVRVGGALVDPMAWLQANAG